MLPKIAFATALTLLAASELSAQAQTPTDQAAVSVHRDIRYREGPSASWKLDLAMRTKDPSGKLRPAIVVIHGGGWIEGDKSSFSSQERPVPGNIIDFAALGFVAVTINYRLSSEAPYPAALDDCRSAVRWLRAHAEEYGIDPNHIGAYGNSAGGHLAMLLGMAAEGLGQDGKKPDRLGIEPRASDGERQRPNRFAGTAKKGSAPNGGQQVYGRPAGRGTCDRLRKGIPNSLGRRGCRSAPSDLWWGRPAGPR